MKKCWVLPLFLLVLISLGCLTTASAMIDKNNYIQVAILLDTSNSMDGLIEQAKTQLWKIVNQLGRADKNGQIVKLQVALYEYGKSSIPGPEGYLRMIVPLTTDLDQISEELFKLSTYGGDEYCGRVIQSAIEGLQWSRSADDYKVIVIAGNEPFTQGEIDYKNACGAAVRKGVIVNSIFCGDIEEGIQTKWKHGADLTGGRYSNINHNREIIYIIAPQDEIIINLNVELNKTYLPYGVKGEESQIRQEKEDSNAGSKSPQILAERSVAKASKVYTNTNWDLVDLVIAKGMPVLETIKTEDLPNEMKKISMAERKKYVAAKIEQRKKLQTQIAQLNEERQKYIEQKMKSQGKEGTLDTAIVNAVREQAVKKGFRFK